MTRTGARGIFLALMGAACTTGAQTDLPTVAIRNTTVIAANGDSPRPATTVVIEGTRIAAIGPTAEVSIPEDARVIEGSARFLIPGLFDMHTHLSKTRASAMGLLVAHGVTTVRDLGGDHEELVRWRREVRAGERVGPRLLIAGPYLESSRNVDRMRNTPPEEMVEPVERTRIPVGSPARARHVVDSLAVLELDMLKFRTVEDTATYFAMAEVAAAHGLPLIGHPYGLSIEQMVRAGQAGMEHFIYPTLDSLARAERLTLFRGLAAAGVTVDPTLMTVGASIFAPSDMVRAAALDSLETYDPRAAYLSRFLLLDWREQALETEARSDEERALLRRVYQSWVRNVTEMQDAGVAIVTGSDLAVLGVFPGEALHREVALLVEDVGMTPMQAIEAATRASAQALGLADSVGTIEVGHVADLVLLEEDPLADINHLGRIAAVILRGRVFDTDGVRALWDSVATAEDRRINDWPRQSTN